MDPSGDGDNDVSRIPASVLAHARGPLEVNPPSDFDPDDATTWPDAPGRWEYLDGRLYWMAPCGEVQNTVVSRLVGLLDRWLDDHPEFRLGTNEAGMRLGSDTRAADCAIWRRGSDPLRAGFSREPPVLSVEVAGQDEGERELRQKSVWYFSHGVERVWVVLPATREILVLYPNGREWRASSGQRLPLDELLPGLVIAVDDVFSRLQ